MPVASLSPSPVIDTTPTTMPTVAQASATGMALWALSTRTVSIWRGPIRLRGRIRLVTTATTRAQNPREHRRSGRSDEEAQEHGGPGEQERSRARSTADRRGSSARSSTGRRQARGLEVDHHADRDEVEHAGNGGGHRDAPVRHAERLGHDEGGGAHHRGDELTAHRRGGLHARRRTRAGSPRGS